MRKIKLDVSTLAVESFTAGTEAPGGTVNAREDVTNFSCALTDDDYTCRQGCPVTNPPAYSCYAPCNSDTCNFNATCTSL